MHAAVTETLRKRPILKSVSTVVLVTFLSLTLQPLAVAAQASSKTAPAQRPANGNDERLARTLVDIEASLGRLEGRLSKKEDASKEKSELKALRQNLEGLNSQALADFDAVGKHLKDKNISSVILARHAASVNTYTTEMTTLRANLDGLEQETDSSRAALKAAKAREHLKATKAKRAPRAKVDPNNLPTRTLKPNRNNKPRMNPGAFHAAGLYSNPTIKLAALGDFTFDKLPGASDPAYLAPSTEVVLSDAIKSLAQALEHNPVNIYNWVHGNVEWVPSWGAMQNADLTLKTLRGNSVDTSSLLIALLRASGIPARYVHGTIETSPDSFLNWSGGFSDINSAMDFASSGGIPITAVVSGGKVTAVRFEHVWVEAAIDFYPSRGAINKSADTWVQLDASSKKYDVTPGVDITAQVPFNSDVYLSQDFQVNPVQYYEQQIQTYLDANSPDQTLTQVLGYREIHSSLSKILPTSTPWKAVVVANRYGAVPSALKTNIQLTFTGTDSFSDRTVAFTTSELAGKRLTLSYVPASAGDETLIASYGGDMYAVPPYLLYLTLALKADGQAIYSDQPVVMGQRQGLRVAYQGPAISISSVPQELVAGGYYALGLDLQGVAEGVPGNNNGKVINVLTTQTAATSQTDDTLGGHLHALVMMYFLMSDKLNRAVAKLHNVEERRTLSAGLIGISPTVSYFFGIPRSATPNRLQADIGLEAGQASSREGSAAKLRSALGMRGLVGSYNENAIFEAVHGFASVSAVKALQKSAAQGIPVYKIDQSNISQILPQLQLAAEDSQEIQNGVAAGLTVIAAQREVTINDWTGTGFIIKNPQTSAGVYRISGGISGGSTTTRGDGLQIVSLFKGPFAWLLDKLDVMTRGIIASIAAIEASISDISDIRIQQKIVDGANTCEANKMSYTEVGTCTGLAVRAHAAAGINLEALADKYGTGYARWVPNLLKLAKALNINNGVRTTNDPLVGDLVFFNYTFDFLKKCSLAANEQPTHVGIVERVNIDGIGTITFIHAGDPVKSGMKMNIEKSTDVSVNEYLRRKPVDGCPADGNSYSYLSGGLFAGFATMRNPKK